MCLIHRRPLQEEVCTLRQSRRIIDGSEFADKLKELSLGVRIEKTEVVRVEQEWFENV